MRSIHLALDVMGGDNAPLCILQGAALAARHRHDLIFHLFGNSEFIENFLSDDPVLNHVSKIYPTTEVISADLKPAQALRGFPQSSMRLAIDSVAKGTTQAVVSAGNTGAYVALSKYLLGMIAEIDRPALPAMIPNAKGDTTILLDVGATLQCDVANYIQFAMMGSCLVQALFQKQCPSVGLLNIGSESSKGSAALQEASQALASISDLNFQGFIEGGDIPHGTVDVVVTDGFSGNIVLKAMEGTASVFVHHLKKALTHSMLGKLGAFIASPVLSEFKEMLDPRLYNGTLLLGLRGLAIKSHGGMDAVGFANAIYVAARLVERELISTMESQAASNLTDLKVAL